MGGRISRLVKRVLPAPLFNAGKKPRLVPMSREEERVQAEIHRRRQLRRESRENRP
jgi:hypothetical protein